MRNPEKNIVALDTGINYSSSLNILSHFSKYNIHFVDV